MPLRSPVSPWAPEDVTQYARFTGDDFWALRRPRQQVAPALADSAEQHDRSSSDARGLSDNGVEDRGCPIEITL